MARRRDVYPHGRRCVVNAAEKVEYLGGRLTSEQLRLRAYRANQELSIRDHEVLLTRLALAIEGQQDAVEDVALKLQVAEAELAEEQRLGRVAPAQLAAGQRWCRW